MLSVCLCTACTGPAVITDAREDRIVIEANQAAGAAVTAEAERGCGFYGRTAELASNTCLDPLCQRRRLEFRCSSTSDQHRARPSPWLGISVDDVRDHLYADPPGSPEVVVSRVFVDGPSARAGLRVGDIIEAFNGVNVADAATLVDVKNGVEAGDRVSMGIRRGADRLRVLVQAQ